MKKTTKYPSLKTQEAERYYYVSRSFSRPKSPNIAARSINQLKLLKKKYKAINQNVRDLSIAKERETVFLCKSKKKDAPKYFKVNSFEKPYVSSLDWRKKEGRLEEQKLLKISKIKERVHPNSTCQGRFFAKLKKKEKKKDSEMNATYSNLVNYKVVPLDNVSLSNFNNFYNSSPVPIDRPDSSNPYSKVISNAREELNVLQHR